MKAEEATARLFKRFPLRLCEVLEKEFITAHGPLSTAPDWLLDKADVDCRKLREYFDSPFLSPNGRAISAIRDKLFTDPRPPRGGEWTKQFEQELLLKLNALLAEPENLYDHTLLDHDNPAAQLARLHPGCNTQKQPRTFQADATTSIAPRSERSAADQVAYDEQLQLNRILLEAAFPADAVARVDTARLTALYGEIRNLEGADGIRSALCLSGGGIRSAAFGLGVLGALARRGVLEKFDYLSTVSGGGYVGSWLSTWIHRHPQGLAGVVGELSTRAREETPGRTSKTEPAPEPIRFLRDYSHFLNPKSGLFTADTWTWVGIYLRNLLLNWLVIIPFLLLALAAPRVYSSLAHSWRVKYGELMYGSGSLFPWIVWMTGCAVLMTLVCINIHRPSVTDTANANSPVKSGRFRRRVNQARQKLGHQGWLVLLGVLPLFAFAVSLTLLVWGLPHEKTALSWFQIRVILSALPLPDIIEALGRIGFDHLVVWGEIIIFVGWLLTFPLLPRRGLIKRINELLAMLFAGFLTFSIISGLADYAAQVGSRLEPAFQLWSFTAYAAHVYTILAVPTVIGATLAGMTLFIGAVSKFQWIEDEDREWWARFGAWILIISVGWVALSTITLFGPPLLLEFPRMIGALGGVSGLIAVLLGKSSLTAAAGQKNATGAGQPKPTASILGGSALTLASAAFLAVFLAFLSLLTSAGLDALLGWVGTVPGFDESAALVALRDMFPADVASIKQACGLQDPLSLGLGVFNDPQLHLEIVCQTRLRLILTLIAGLVVFLAAASAVINLNKFSLHAVYRIRIVRTFLGASRGTDRRPNAFTGFDPLDDVQMHELQSGLLREGDIVDIGRFVGMLREALLKDGDAKLAPRDPAQLLVQLMCTRAFDPASVLTTRLRNAAPNAPVLRALQQDVLETLNRVMETIRLDKAKAFIDLRKQAGQKDAFALVDHYYRQGNVIFGNRKLVEMAFPDQVRQYDFPPPPPHKLLHVINLTLNLVHGSKLAWQERKAAPFVVTPMHAGTYYLGFRNARDYGGDNGISIGTAVAVSGAAVSPNMGYSSSTLTALLLTLFNVRLGWWLGNPGVAGADTYRLAEPRVLLRPLWSEAFGMTDDQSPYIYLSDGGHFENLGLFEMVLRRCRFIVVSDAGADPDYQFEDIGNAVRKIRIDLGIPIEFESIPIHRQTGPDDDSGRYCAIGRIRYSNVDGEDAPDGLLICFKPVLCGKESRDVQHYAAKNPDFPQEPTSNQFYGESQFESYRQLGEIAVETVFGAEPPPESNRTWAEDIVESTRAHLGAKGGKAYWIDAWLFGLK